MNAFELLEGLLIIEQNNYDIRSYFSQRDVGSIILYGLGRVGIRAYEAIKKSGTNIECICDRNANSIEFHDERIVLPQELGREDIKSKLIVITPAMQYDEIRRDIIKYTSREVISLEEIIKAILNGKIYLKAKLQKHNVAVNGLKRIDKVGRSRAVLIFGGGSGIGKAIAKKMLEEGAMVTIAGRSIERLRKVEEEINNKRLSIAAMDITQVDKHIEYLEEAKKNMNGLDAVVNSTLYSLKDPGREFDPWDVTSEEWDNMSDTDFKAAFFIIRNTVNYFLSNNIAGNILSISSIAGYEDIIGCYGASKLAIARWTKAFGKRFGHDGIVINAIAPGSTFTGAIAFYAKHIDQECPSQAIDRFIRPDEIADLAWYCLSDKGVILCGSTIVADGGTEGSFI